MDLDKLVTGYAHKLIITLLLFIFLSATSNASDSAINTLVLQPQVKGAAKLIYDSVSQGIALNPRLTLHTQIVSKKTSGEEIDSIIAENDFKLVIAIGNTAAKLAAQLNTPAKVIAGGVASAIKGIPTLSLTADPKTALEQVQQINPNVTEIRVVYSSDLNAWWLDQAKQAEAETGIKVFGYQAENLKQGVRLYETLFAQATSKKTALWIPLKSIVPSKTILPLVLENAWSKKVPVISNNPSHTKLGGFLSFFPRHRSMGEQLASFAIAHYERSDAPTIVGTKSLSKAVNERTSAHLGNPLTHRQLNAFDRVFPTQQ